MENNNETNKGVFLGTALIALAGIGLYNIGKDLCGVVKTCIEARKLERAMKGLTECAEMVSAKKEEESK